MSGCYKTKITSYALLAAAVLDALSGLCDLHLRCVWMVLWKFSPCGFNLDTDVKSWECGSNWSYSSSSPLAAITGLMCLLS